MADVPENEQRDESEGRLDRRSVLKYGGAGAGAAGLAGCQSRENPLLGPGDLRVPGDGPQITDGDGDGPLSGQTVKVGVLAPMGLPLGESMWDGARMAADYLSEEGRLLGANVEVVQADTKLSPGTAASEHQRLIIQEGCDMTCGNFLGSGLLQTMPSIANQKKIHVTTGSAIPTPGRLVSKSVSVTGDPPEEEYERFKYHFRAGPINLLDLADALLEFVEANKDELGWEKAALMTENLGEFQPYHDRLKKNLSNVIDVPLTYRPGGISDWSPIYNELENNDVDIALVGLALSGTTAVNQWAQQERNFEFGGIHVPSQSFAYWESTDGNTEHVFTMNAMTPQTSNTELTQPFVQDYIDRFDRVPIYTAPITYDAILNMEQVYTAIHEEEGLDGIPEADTIIPYMEEMTFTGSTIMSEFQFTAPDAEFAHEPLWTSTTETGVPVYQQWQYDPEVREDYGTMHSFYPPQNKTSDYTVPDWVEGGN